MRIEETPDSPKPSGNLRGLEKFARPPEEVRETAEDVGDIALGPVTGDPKGLLRSLEKFSSPSTTDKEAKLIPEGYDMPAELAERAMKLAADPTLPHFEDPESLITPGTLLFSPKDTEHRRLVTNIYTNDRGVPTVRVHVEGSKAGLHNLRLDELRQKIADGDLVLPPPAPAK